MTIPEIGNKKIFGSVKNKNQTLSNIHTSYPNEKFAEYLKALLNLSGMVFNFTGREVFV